MVACICKRKIISEMIKVGNDSFRHTQFSPKASEMISQRRFLPKLKVCPSSVSSTNSSAQNSKKDYLVGCMKQFFPSASIRSEFILTLLLWEGIHICKKKDYFWNDKGRKRFFLSHSIWSKSISNNFSEIVFAKIKNLSIGRIINKPVSAKFKTGK